LIPPSAYSFILAFRKELKYRHLDERINSGDDAATWCKNGELRSSNPGDNVAQLCTFEWLLGVNWPTNLHSSRWHSQTLRTIEIPIGALKAAMIRVHLI